MVIRITSAVATIIQAVSPLLGDGAAQRRGCGGVARLLRPQRRCRRLRGAAAQCGGGRRGCGGCRGLVLRDARHADQHDRSNRARSTDS